MTTLHAPDMYVVIGDEYAKRLGYEGLVGSMGIIDNVLNALCGITILSGRQEMVGKQVDIHIQDCILQDMGGENQYGVVINLSTGQILYSNNIELVEHTQDYLTGRFQIRKFENIRHIHEVLDFCIKEMPRTAKIHNFEWICFCLDDESCEETKVYRDTFEADKTLQGYKQEAFQQEDSKQKKPNNALTNILKLQMETQVKEQLGKTIIDDGKLTLKSEGGFASFIKFSPVEDDEEDDDGPYDDSDYESAW